MFSSQMVFFIEVIIEDQLVHIMEDLLVFIIEDQLALFIED